MCIEVDINKLIGLLFINGRNFQSVIFCFFPLGFNDIGYNNPDVKTPNLDKLAAEGVILNNNYAMHACTPYVTVKSSE